MYWEYLNEPTYTLKPDPTLTNSNPARGITTHVSDLLYLYGLVQINKTNLIRPAASPCKFTSFRSWMVLSK